MKVKPYKETHMEGYLFLDGVTDVMVRDKTKPLDFGISIAEDGRVWLCIDGISFLRFRPTDKYLAVGNKLEGGKG